MKWCRYQLGSIICLDLISYNFILFMYDILRIAYMYTMCFDQNPRPQCFTPTLLRSLIPYFPPNFIPLVKKGMEGLLFSEDKWRRIESGEEGEWEKGMRGNFNRDECIREEYTKKRLSRVFFLKQTFLDFKMALPRFSRLWRSCHSPDLTVWL